MRKLLFALGAVALMGSAAMAAEPLTDQQMDRVAAGFDFPNFPNILIDTFNPIVMTAINQPIAVSLGCGTTSACAAASVVIPQLSPPSAASNGFEVFSTIPAVPSMEKVAVNFNFSNNIANEPSSTTATVVINQTGIGPSCGTGSTCAVATLVLPTLTPASNVFGVASNPSLPQVVSASSSTISVSSSIINGLSSITLAALNQPITTGLGCTASSCAIAITSVAFPSFFALR
ncbi:MAG TPA: hypothetical protein VLX09_15130 [Stellaceae bacterium]|nr:hypothetical protein [Stellaceae bacterium]